MSVRHRPRAGAQAALAFAGALLAPACARASFGGGGLDLTFLVVIAGALAGLAMAAMHVLVTRLRSAELDRVLMRLGAAALLLALLAWAASRIPGWSAAIAVAGITLPLAALLLAPVGLVRIVPWGWLRVLVLGLPLAWLLWRLRDPRTAAAEQYFLAPVLIPWALAAVTGGHGAARATGGGAGWIGAGAGAVGGWLRQAVRSAMTSRDGIARRIRASEEGRARVTLPASVQFMGMTLGMYGLGFLGLTTDLPGLHAVLLALADTLAPGPSAPAEGGEAALAYWLSFGLLPSLVFAGLVLAVRLAQRGMR